jgi:uncharacterized protein YlxP (DUF503 family)
VTSGYAAGTVFAAVVEFELFIPDCHTLKHKRAVLRPVLEGLQRRFRVSAAEVGQQDKWQRADIGIATVAGSHSHVLDVLDAVERFVWSFPEVEVLSQRRSWLETDDAPEHHRS